MASGLIVTIDGARDLVVDGVPVEVRVHARTPSPSDVLRALERTRQREARNYFPTRRLLIVMPSVPASIRRLAEDNPALAVAGVGDKLLVCGRQARFINLVDDSADVRRPRGRPALGAACSDARPHLR